MDDDAELLKIAELLRVSAEDARDAAMLRPKDVERLEPLAAEAEWVAQQLEDTVHLAPLATALGRNRDRYVRWSRKGRDELDRLVAIRIRSKAIMQLTVEQCKCAVAESRALLDRLD